LQTINNSMITLVPKVSNPRNVGDFRPISLLNSVLILITKLLTNILQLIILKLIHRNQFGFIRTRTIQAALLGHLSIFTNVINLERRLSYSNWISKKLLTLWNTTQ
jgi:hypothetical protein